MKKLFTLLFLSLLLFCSLCRPIQTANAIIKKKVPQQKILPVSYDNEVSSLHNNLVDSTSVYVTVGNFDWGSLYGNEIRRYYFSIDLSELPKKSKIDTATLFLDRVSSTWDIDNAYELYRVKKDWDTITLNWDNQPAVSKKLISSGTYTNYGIFTFDISSEIKHAVNNSQKYFGFMLRKPKETGNNFGLFATQDYPSGGSETRPYVEITYTIPNH